MKKRPRNKNLDRKEFDFHSNDYYNEAKGHLNFNNELESYDGRRNFYRTKSSHIGRTYSTREVIDRLIRRFF